MRRFFLIALLIFGSIFIASAQDSEDVTDFDVLETTTWTCPEGFEGQTLNVYNWSTYIGDTTISDFEALCGVTVTYDVYDSNESLISRLRQGNPGYDVAFPTEYAIVVMSREGLIQPIDLENIPNFENVADRWKGLSFDPENEYSVPYLWGSFGVGYNTERVDGPITSWEQVFEHDGPVAWIEDQRSMMAVALILLGYEASTTDPDEIAEARDFLLERSSNVVVFADDDGQTLLERGEVDIALEYNGDMYQLIVDCECDTYSYAIPEEGSIADIAGMVVPTDAPNPQLAQVFMDYILDPVVNAAIVNYTLYATPNQAAIDSGLIDADFLANPAITPDEAAMENLVFLEDVSEAEQFYNDAWDELRILAGS